MNCNRPTYTPVCNPAADTRIGTCAEARGPNVPPGCGAVSQGSYAFSRQPNVPAFDTLISGTAAVTVVPLVTDTSIESEFTMIPAVKPVTDVWYTPRPNVAASNTPPGCRREMSVIGV